MRRIADQLLAAPGLTRGRFIALAVLSLLATATVIAAAAPPYRTPWALVAAARARQAPVVEVASRPAPRPASAPAPAATGSRADAGAAAAPVDVATAPAPVTPAAPAADPTPAPTPAAPAPTPAKPVSKIKHVFVVSAAGAGYDATWGPGAQASYLNGTLRPQGRLLTGYHPLAAGDLATQVALTAGQKPTPGIEQGCPTYGGDCLFPVETLTLPDQVVALGQRWRAYVESMPQACAHPDAGAVDPGAGDYTTRNNPFVYFRSLTELGGCMTNDLPLDALDADLASADATPNLTFVAPDRCDGGWSATCADGSAGGPARADAFLAQWIPKILESPAYKADGLLIVLLGAPDGASPADAKTGALLVSQFATPASSSDVPYDAYGVLRSVEDLFGLDYLAGAGDSSVPSFAKSELAAGLPTG
jgi:hypothetical protein